MELNKCRIFDIGKKKVERTHRNVLCLTHVVIFDSEGHRLIPSRFAVEDCDNKNKKINSVKDEDIFLVDSKNYKPNEAKQHFQCPLIKVDMTFTGEVSMIPS